MNNPVITYHKDHMISTYLKSNGDTESHIYEEHESKNSTWKVVGGSYASSFSEITSIEKAHSKINSY